MAVRRIHGGLNVQAGSMAPVESPWGQALEDATPRLIDQPLPIGTRPRNFGGTVGGIHTASASVLPIWETRGYFGDAPQSLQDFVPAPPPWKRP